VSARATKTCVHPDGVRRPHDVPALVISGYERCASCGREVYVSGSEGTAAQSLQRHEGLAALADRRDRGHSSADKGEE
jgi:hypothetical protein